MLTGSAAPMDLKVEISAIYTCMQKKSQKMVCPWKPSDLVNLADVKTDATLGGWFSLKTMEKEVESRNLGKHLAYASEFSRGERAPFRHTYRVGILTAGQRKLCLFARWSLRRMAIACLLKGARGRFTEFSLQLEIAHTPEGSN